VNLENEVKMAMYVYKERSACGVGFVASIKGERSNKILKIGVESVKNLIHRGAVSADGKTGDGAGIMTQIPLKIVKKELEKRGINNLDPEKVAIGVFFLPNSQEHQHFIFEITESFAKELGFSPLFWRDVPQDENALGEIAKSSKPQIKHLYIKYDGSWKEAERKLYILRKFVEKKSAEKKISIYIPSISTKKIVYKGLFVATQVDKFYLDLQDPEYETAICIFHQRYSTNTHPHWFIAHPFRFLAHNGEINTLLGNINWTRAREKNLSTKVWSKDELEIIRPIIWEGGSDSSMLDNMLEFLYFSGRELPEAMAMLIPEPYEVVPDMPEDVKSFFEYYDYFTEPWDGPAAIAFSDGVGVGACLDRNGLRPARVGITKDGLVIVSSEIGVAREIPLEEFEEIDRLGPGKMIYIDTQEGKLYRDHEIKGKIAKSKPYSVWIKKSKKFSTEITKDEFSSIDEKELIRLQKAFGYTEEDIERFFKEMALFGKEATYSMGDDTPFAFMSKVPRNIFSYFKQRFAQVTNPPIDPYREYIVMSLSTTIGEKGDITYDDEEHANVIRLDSPIITEEILEELKKNLPFRIFETVFDLNRKSSLREKIYSIAYEAADAVEKDGIKLIILSDRTAGKEGKVVIPSLMVVGAVHQELVRRGLRLKASIVVDSGEPREEHHFACLLGYGADAILPWLAFLTAYHIKEEHRGKAQEIQDRLKLVKNYKSAVEKGIKKIMSKMGISHISSYRGAQIFEIIGLKDEIVDFCFTGTPNWFGQDGVGYEELADDYIEFYRWSEDPSPLLPNLGFFKFIRGREYHEKNPFVFRPLHKFTETGNKEFYKEFTAQVQSRPPVKIRDLFDIKPLGDPVPIDEVEPVENIVKRFYVSSMSFGALSPEAHETLAIGVNRIGANMGSGEGGEDPRRFEPYENGDLASSTMKQIASGRFGVTTEYAVNCRELEIKIAQGSKPGEGGQLPGIKVTEEIARVRRSVPGITLISPPPHHDIYSIEDLAQLIYDLKKVNPQARVSVKLVAEAGVGIIAAGVAKAYADTIQISGHDGGTGASPASSIKNAGIAWELGLIETQAILIWNDLRERVRLRVDGGMLNGWDVVKAAVLGAEEYGFGSSAMIAIGCIMARQCHLNTCPVGIASQKEELRRKFPGFPERIERYFIAIAEEVREILASLGARSLNEIIGRIDLIKPKNIQLEKTKKNVNISYLKKLFLNIAEGGENPFVYDLPDKLDSEIDEMLDKRILEILSQKSISNKLPRNDRPETEEEDLNGRIVKDAWENLEKGKKVKLKYKINNSHRSVGATLAGLIAKKWGDGISLKPGLKPRTVEIEFEGVAGQSFGAFLTRGMRFILRGVANDYLGKALSGGEIVVIPPVNNAVAIGNVCIYGGTSGYLFVKGRAGERFAVRNSGVFAVIEGAGDHCMEYMTGGICVVAGPVGKNLGAGMTGGIGFVMWSDLLPRLINSEWIFLKNIDEEEEFKVLEKLLYLHAVQTGSDIPKKLLAEIDMVRVVVPKEFQKYKSNFLKDAILKIEIDFADFLPPASKGISITQNQ
jgi:glutamate synthase (ferredoxin)